MQAETTGAIRRDFVEYDHPDGLYTLEAHKVTPDTEGEVTVAGHETVSVRAGQVLVRNGNFYEVHSGDAFDAIGLVPVRDQQDLEQQETPVEAEKLFDPSEHTAAEVRRYLRNPELSDEERTRVIDAERDGNNRVSAFPV